MVRLVSGDLGVVYHKVIYCVRKCLLQHQQNLVYCLRKVFICFMSRKRVWPQVNPSNQEKNTNISNLKNQDLYGIEKSKRNVFISCMGGKPSIRGGPLYKWERARCISQTSLLRKRFIYYHQNIQTVQSSYTDRIPFIYGGGLYKREP